MPNTHARARHDLDELMTYTHTHMLHDIDKLITHTHTHAFAGPEIE